MKIVDVTTIFSKIKKQKHYLKENEDFFNSRNVKSVKSTDENLVTLKQNNPDEQDAIIRIFVVCLFCCIVIIVGITGHLGSVFFINKHGRRVGYKRSESCSDEKTRLKKENTLLFKEDQDAFDACNLRDVAFVHVVMNLVFVMICYCGALAFGIVFLDGFSKDKGG